MATISELFKKYVVPTTTKAPTVPKIATGATAGASVGSVAPVVPAAISGSTAGFDMSNYKADITEAGVPKATLPSLINVNTAKQINTLQKTATGAGVQAGTQMQPQNALQYNPNQTAGLNVIQQAQPKQTAPQPAPVQTAQPVNVQIPSTLSSEDISSTTTQFKGSQGTSTSTADQFMASLNPSLSSLGQTTQQAEQLANQMTAGGISQLQDEQTKLRQEISKLSGDMSQSARKAELEQQYGLNEQLTQLSELNKQIASKSAQYQQAIIENQGRNTLTSQIAGREGQLKRQMAVEIGGLTAMAEAMQGNIDMARSIIKDTVALEYEDKQNQLNTLLQQLEWNREDMTKEEQKQAAKMEADAKAQQAQLEIAQKNREQIMEIAAQAAGKGADFNTLQQMLTATSPEDALLMSGGYLATPSELEMYQAKKEIDAMYDAGKMTELEMYEAKKAIDEGFARQKTQEVDTAQAQNIIFDANNKLQTIDSVLAVFEGGSSSIVGTGAGIGPGIKNLWEDITGENQRLLASVEQLISQETMKTLTDLKAAGGTLGALSEKELEMLQGAATKLNTYAIKDANGKIVGFNVPESTFVAEINKMREATQRMKDKAGSLLPANSIDEYYSNSSVNAKAVDNMVNSGLYKNMDEIWEAIQINKQSFNTVGGDTKQASIQSKIASAIPGGTQYTKPTDGECGYWSRKIVDYPSGTGNSLAEKTAFVKREGLQRDAWLKAGPKVGDVIFTNDSKDYGHVAVVNSINPDGSITVSESNYKGHYLVSHDRKIPLNSNSIIGAVRGKLKTNISNIA